MSTSNKGLLRAAKNRDDEFYTRRQDIEAELSNYDFSDKTVYCNCDTRDSEFYRYFSESGRCRELLCTGLGNPGTADGRFEHELEYLKRADVVVTNPPFSKMNDFLPLLLQYNKDFLILGPLTLVKNKCIRDEIISGKIHAGFNTRKGIKFRTPHAEESLKGSAVIWYTTLPVPSGTTSSYVRYNPHCAEFTDSGSLFIRKTADIPYDYRGVMAVPITYFSVMDSGRFRITGIELPIVHGKKAFGRLQIQSVIKYDKLPAVCSAERFLGEWEDEDYEKNENLE